MAEAEDVIVDAARHATSYAMDLWRRNRPPEPGPSRTALVDVRARLELLLEGALGRAFPIRPAYPPRPATLLERLMGREPLPLRRTALPATDGASVYLPRELDGAMERSLELYRIAAFQQAYRCMRGTAAAFPRDETLAVRDLYLLSEAVATERALARLLPGISAAMARVRVLLLAARPPLETMPEPLRSVEVALPRDARRRCRDPASHASPSHSLAWAQTFAATLPAPTARYRGLVSDLLLGEIVSAEHAQASTAASEATNRRNRPTRSRRPARPPTPREGRRR